jgi:hypothetical protein
MSEIQVSNNRWARFVYTFTTQWGMQHKVEEIQESDSQPQGGEGEWGQCYFHTQVGWFFLHGIFISNSQMASFKIYSTNKSHPLNPRLENIKIILYEGREVHAYYEIRIDINNTSFDEFKKSIPAFAKEHFIRVNFDVARVGATESITEKLIYETKQKGYVSKEELQLRLHSAAHGHTIHGYINGQKQSVTEPTIKVANNDFDLLNTFDFNKYTVVVCLNRTDKNPQIFPITWWEWILGSIIK